MEAERWEEIKEHGCPFIIWRNFPPVVRIAKFSNQPPWPHRSFQNSNIRFVFDARTPFESHGSENAKSHWLHLLNYSPLCVSLAHPPDHLPLFKTYLKNLILQYLTFLFSGLPLDPLLQTQASSRRKSATRSTSPGDSQVFYLLAPSGALVVIMVY